MAGIQGGDILNISIVNQLRAFNFGFVGTLFMLATIYFLDFNYSAIKIFGIFWLALTLPALYLHLEYLIKNRRQSMQVATDKLILTEGNISTDYKFENMEKVILYKSASLDKGGIPLSPIESYHYARIITKSNEELIITCLLVPKVDEVVSLLKGVKYERKKRPFCTMYWR